MDQREYSKREKYVEVKQANAGSLQDQTVKPARRAQLPAAIDHGKSGGRNTRQPHRHRHECMLVRILEQEANTEEQNDDANLGDDVPGKQPLPPDVPASVEWRCAGCARRNEPVYRLSIDNRITQRRRLGGRAGRQLHGSHHRRWRSRSARAQVRLLGAAQLAERRNRRSNSACAESLRFRSAGSNWPPHAASAGLLEAQQPPVDVFERLVDVPDLALDVRQARSRFLAPAWPSAPIRRWRPRSAPMTAPKKGCPRHCRAIH
jgi:hypothetical protein